jgi:hypothetical protein
MIMTPSSSSHLNPSFVSFFFSLLLVTLFEESLGEILICMWNNFRPHDNPRLSSLELGEQDKLF